MTYEARRSRAFWRGFEFLTDSHEASDGRRLVVHEFPGADEVEVEDMGRAARSWRINVYFIGPDYDLERNGFLAKLQEPGPDWLTHPWTGLVWARAQNWRLAESNKENGMCRIEIDFVPGGRQPYEPVVDKVDIAFARIARLKETCEAQFEMEPMSADALMDFKAKVDGHLEQLRNVISLASMPLAWASQVVSVIEGVRGDIDTILNLPSAYAGALGSILGSLGAGADLFGVSASHRPRVVTKIATAAIAAAAAFNAGGGPAYRINVAREQALRSQLMAISAAQVGLADYEAEQDRDAVLSNVVAAIDYLLPGMEDDVFQAAVSARAALIEALLAQDLAPAVTRDVVKPLPSVVLAYQMEISESRLLAQNAVRHPLFVNGAVNG